MTETFKQVSELFETMQDDFQKFNEKSNKSAGARVRKSALQIQKLLKLLRAEVQETKNSL